MSIYVGHKKRVYAAVFCAARLPQIALKACAIDKHTGHFKKTQSDAILREKKETFNKHLSLTWVAVDLRKRKGAVGKDNPSECGVDAFTAFLPQLLRYRFFSPESVA